MKLSPLWWRVCAMGWACLGGVALLAILGAPLGSFGEQLVVLPGVAIYGAMEWLGMKPSAHTLLTDSAHGPPFLNVVGVAVFYALPAAGAIWWSTHHAGSHQGRSGNGATRGTG